MRTGETQAFSSVKCQKPGLKARLFGNPHNAGFKRVKHVVSSDFWHGCECIDTCFAYQDGEEFWKSRVHISTVKDNPY